MSVRGEIRVGLFACKNIKKGDELSFDYSGVLRDHKKQYEEKTKKPTKAKKKVEAASKEKWNVPWKTSVQRVSNISHHHHGNLNYSWSFTSVVWNCQKICTYTRESLTRARFLCPVYVLRSSRNVAVIRKQFWENTLLFTNSDDRQWKKNWFEIVIRGHRYVHIFWRIQAEWRGVKLGNSNSFRLYILLL